MATRNYALTIGTSATEISAEESKYSRTETATTVIRPLDGDIFVGGVGVTAANGLPVRQDELFAIDSPDDIYAIAEANVNVRVLRLGVD
jgi:hypothetical protein